MRKLMSGLAVATVLSLAPATASVAVTPTQTTESRVSAVAEAKPLASSTESRKATRTMSVKDTPGRQARLRIFVRPEYGNKPILVQRIRNGKFRTVDRVRTNAKGVAIRVFEGSRRGIRYRVVAPGGQKYETVGRAFTITKTFF